MTPESPQTSTTLWARGGKRLGDVVGAGLLLVILSPILLVAAAFVKLTSPGPLLFSQDRGGRNGRPFRLHKFRTMHGGRTPDPKELVPLDHPEITRVGRFFRRSKIDELPQLVNVLKGDMSLVGPRPTLLDQVEAYDDFRRQRLLVRPGCTGLAQVNTSAAVPWDERILYDIAYVRRCSLWLDVGILLRTMQVLMVGEERMIRPFMSSPYTDYVNPPEDYPIISQKCADD